MSRLQTDSTTSMSSERQTQSLREVHERLVSYVQAHSALGKATLNLADSIVDFYLPQVSVPATLQQQQQEHQGLQRPGQVE